MVTEDLENKELELTKKLAANPRISIKRLADDLDMNYTALRDRIRKLSYKGLISFILSVSPLITGNTAALVRLKGHKVEKLLSSASKCNRVITGLKVSDDEAILVIYGKDKGDIVSVIDVLRDEAGGDLEIHVEYGRLHPDFKVQIRNPNPECNHPPCNNCIPVLRNRVKNSSGLHGTP
ncbi:putative transcriptional regulator, AsnC family [Desulfurococcus amylolyticus 1221n]|uniref:Putative transcriptional regulator, AsnC family n=1 Tax=Desulfurococcus amylolyticus (strain DSM 18924 / JCM 16383 / VKM B-2413 / 1221n) TaxID=490899 RepID=B8D551_DESA1|nr:Lrp/AsnC family transcriptional regulator [Desulfurococcus amylolyticus]ACL11232.1 putative transcriptional regulator, AsnC family [Desulfurococcus amylolyticus 1221n]